MGGLGSVAQPRKGDDPRRVGPYEIVGRLGAGAMGQVFLGRAGDGALAAVKVVRADLADIEEFRARFRREVRIVRTIRGTRIARVLDADADAARPWIATEWVDGPSLQTMVDRHGPLDAPRLRVLALEIALALRDIHAAGVVHRDLKPSNVLLARDGVRVIDFGVAHIADASLALTGTGYVPGTPAYMSPEQVNAQALGPASDVFSLGTLLVFAATGRLAFGEGAALAVMARIDRGTPDLDGVAEGDRVLRELIEACLQRVADARPTPEAIAAALGVATPAAEPAPTGLAAFWPEVPLADLDTETTPVVRDGSPIPWYRRRAVSAVVRDGSAVPWYRRRAVLAVAGTVLTAAAVVAVVLVVPGGGGVSADASTHQSRPTAGGPFVSSTDTATVHAGGSGTSATSGSTITASGGSQPAALTATGSTAATAAPANSSTPSTRPSATTSSPHPVVTTTTVAPPPSSASPSSVPPLPTSHDIYGNATNPADVVLEDSDGTVLTAGPGGTIITAPWRGGPEQHWTFVTDSTNSYQTISPHSSPNLLLEGAQAGGVPVLAAQDPDGRSHFDEYYDLSFQSLRKALNSVKYGTCISGTGANNPVKIVGCSGGSRILEWSFVSP